MIAKGRHEGGGVGTPRRSARTCRAVSDPAGARPTVGDRCGRRVPDASRGGCGDHGDGAAPARTGWATHAVTVVGRWRRPLTPSQRRRVVRLAARHPVVITPTHVEVHVAARYVAAEELLGGSPPAWWVATAQAHPGATPAPAPERGERDALG